MRRVLAWAVLAIAACGPAACTAGAPSTAENSTRNLNSVSTGREGDARRSFPNAKSAKNDAAIRFASGAQNEASGADHATMIAALSGNLIGFAGIDGALVTGMRPEGACAATIDTRTGPVRFD